MAVRLRHQKKLWLLKRYRGRGYVDTSVAPRWWLTRPDEIEAYLRSLARGQRRGGVEVLEVGRSAGGRPILAAAWGAREDLPGRTTKSVACAIGGGSPEAFYGRGQRQRQVFLFVGATHGTEFEGTVAALNFLNAVVTGKDLRGRRQPRLAELGRRLRLVIIPIFNMDGRERFREVRHLIGVAPEALREITDGNWKDGRPIGWPQCMLYNPLPVDKVDPLGSYFNDNGIDLGYDCGFGWDLQPETRGLVRLMRDELPDCVLFSHSNNGSLVEPPHTYLPPHFRQRVMQISAVVGMRCYREGLKKHGIPMRPESTRHVFYQMELAYHVCGALPLCVEFPCGYQNYPGNHEEILDIGLCALEEIAAFGVAYGFRPPEMIKR